MDTNISNLAPKASDYWDEMPTFYKTANVFLFIILLAILGMTIKMLRDVLMNVKDDLVQSDLLWVLGTPLMVTLCCAVGNIFPRSAELLYSIGLIILMVSLYKVVSLVYNAFGGTEKFSYWLQDRDRRMRLNVPPLCCCCRCLPSPSPTIENLHRLKWVVLQSPVVRIIVQLVLLIMTWEEIAQDAKSNQLVNLLGVISTMFGVYVTHILISMAKEFLDEHGLMVLVRSADLAQGLFTGIKAIFDAIAKNSNFGDTDFMNSQANGNFCFNVTASILFFILALVQFIFVRPGRCKLFSMKILATD
ncbi:unnamed protein product, partial [Mesorhabditis belari]|uniref:Uncharacterized protein n=1 Tax=Mesorhabditis belari TaxID=2138241 RepID=A0AAF3JBG8_9BILA